MITAVICKITLVRSNYAKVRCHLCDELVEKETAHRHQGSYIGDECCWDERLKATE